MRKKSSGTLLYREVNNTLQVLIVRSSGKHQTWSIPKGNVEDGESLEQAARRETQEETGIIAKDLLYIGEVTYKSKSKKKVHCFVGHDKDSIPKCNSWEIDKAEFVDLDLAQSLLHSAQQEFVQKFKELYKNGNL